MKFHVLTLIPEAIEAYFSSSIMGKGVERGLFDVKAYDLRKWGKGKHKKVDDEPYGGGPGMAIMLEPIYKGVKEIENNINKLSHKNRKILKILFSIRGDVFNDEMAKDLASYDDLILICGRYEGVDERVAEHIADKEVSIGGFVLSGGEIPAMAVIDAVARKIPGVLGTTESLEEIKGSYPVYTRPRKFYPDNDKVSWNVPEELVGGNHKKIDEWRKKWLKKNK